MEEFNLKLIYDNPMNYSSLLDESGYLIYRIRNLINNKSYIGDTFINLYNRFFTCWNGGHFGCYENDEIKSHLYNSMRKYGLEYFSVSIIYKGDYDPTLESKFILKFNSYENGYNNNPTGKSAVCGGNLDTIAVHKGDEVHYVGKLKVHEFLKDGFELGTGLASNLGKIAVNNGIQVKFIKESELNKFTSNGWVRGLINSPTGGCIAVYNDDGYRYIDPNEENYYLSIGYKRSRGFGNLEGMILVTNGSEDIYIDSNKLDEYIKIGYRLGRSKTFDGFIRIHNDDGGTICTETELEQKLSEGYKLGSGVKPLEDLIAINKDGEVRYIDPNSLDEWIQKGWIQGRGFGNLEGMIKITNGKEDKFIDPNDFLEWQSKGYRKGSKSKRLWVVNSEGDRHFVTYESIKNWYSKGYRWGMNWEYSVDLLNSEYKYLLD